MNKLIQSAKQFWNDEQGVTAVEYALILALIAAAIIAGYTLISTAVEAKFDEVAGQISGGGD
jgi:pilus assembly protein Flp/PilA